MIKKGDPPNPSHSSSVAHPRVDVSFIYRKKSSSIREAQQTIAIGIDRLPIK